MISPNWARRARLLSVRDGDTVVLEADCGYGIFAHVVVRLNGINTPEIVGPEHHAGMAAKAYAMAWYPLPSATDPFPLVLVTDEFPGDKYGRWLGTIYRDGDPVSLNDALIAGGYAKPYDGTGPKP